MIRRIALRAPILALALSSSALAETSTNLLVNGRLDMAAGATPAGSSTGIANVAAVNSTALTGWRITGGTIDVVPTSYWDAPTGMNYSVDLIGTPGTGSATPSITQATSGSQLGVLSQEVSTVAGKTYQLSFDLSVNPTTGPLREYATIKRLLVEAVPESVVVLDGEAASSASIGITPSKEYDLARGTRHPENMQWIHETFSFTASSTLTAIQFSALMPLNAPTGSSPSNIYCGPAIGNISLTLVGGGGPVPEPASLGLLGVGVSVLLFKRRRGR
jgi:hypothetical protein